jgi:hypothetical protein
MRAVSRHNRKPSSLPLRSVQPRRSLWLLVGLALFVLLGTAAKAHAAVQLPDLEQQVPKEVQIGGSSGAWQIGFLSEVVNRGSGPLEIRGSGPGGQQNMVATQFVLNGGSMQPDGVVGDLHYETGFGHKHWHFEPFDHYELRSLSGVLIGTDEKEGFCLGDNNNHGGGSAVYDDPSFCQQNNPNATSLTEGISPGWGDSYDPLKEGQDVPINQSTSPTGDYNLVHRVNENPDGSHGPVHESGDFKNNVASAWIHLSWTNGTPKISVLKTCMATALCGPVPPAPPAPPQPPPAPPSPPVTPNTPPPDTFAPSLVIAKLKTEHVKPHTSALFINARCSEQCTLSAQGIVSIGGAAAKVLRTGKATLTLPAGTRTKVLLPLSKSLRKTIRRALAHHRRVLVKVTIKVVDAAGNAATHRYTLKLSR